MCARYTRIDDEDISHEVVSWCETPDTEQVVLTCNRYHWSVEYFEDLRNVNHCEFIVMKLSPTNNKYILQNELRTWSELKRRAAEATSSPSKGLPAPGEQQVRRWGGCVNGCNHDKTNWPKRVMRKNTLDYLGNPLPPPATCLESIKGEGEDHPIAAQEADHNPGLGETTSSKITRKPSTHKSVHMTPASPNDASNNPSTSEGDADSEQEEALAVIGGPHPRTAAIAGHLKPPPSNPRTANLGAHGEGFSDDSDYFPGMQHVYAHGGSYPHTHGNQIINIPSKTANGANSKPKARASSKHRQRSKDRKILRKMSEKDWQEETGMGKGARADALGDGDDISDNHRCASPTLMEEEKKKKKEEEILKEAYKAEQKQTKEELENVRKVIVEDIDKMKDAERKGFGEIY